MLLEPNLSTKKVALFRPGGQKNPYIDSCLKPLYNGLCLLSPGGYFTFSKKIKKFIFCQTKVAVQGEKMKNSFEYLKEHVFVVIFFFDK